MPRVDGNWTRDTTAWLEVQDVFAHETGQIHNKIGLAHAMYLRGLLCKCFAPCIMLATTRWCVSLRPVVIRLTL